MSLSLTKTSYDGVITALPGCYKEKMKVLSAHTNEQDKQVIKAVIFDKDGVLLDLEATWLNSAIAMTHFVSELTDGQHKPKAFQAIIGIDEETRQIDANGLFAAGSSADQFLELSLIHI